MNFIVGSFYCLEFIPFFIFEPVIISGCLIKICWIFSFVCSLVCVSQIMKSS